MRSVVCAPSRVSVHGWGLGARDELGGGAHGDHRPPTPHLTRGTSPMKWVKVGDVLELNVLHLPQHPNEFAQHWRILLCRPQMVAPVSGREPAPGAHLTRPTPTCAQKHAMVRTQPTAMRCSHANLALRSRARVLVTNTPPAEPAPLGGARARPTRPPRRPRPHHPPTRGTGEWPGRPDPVVDGRWCKDCRQPISHPAPGYVSRLGRVP